MDITTDPPRHPEVLAPGAGDHFHFLNHLATVKVRPERSGAMAVVEFVAPRGFGPPLHRHQHEDEVFLVQEGEIAFHSGDDVLVTSEGGVAFLPHGLAHTFQVRSSQARFTCVTAARTGEPRFDQLVTALGVGTAHPTLPTPGYIDATHVADVCRQHDIEVLGPPPAPLDVTSPTTSTRSPS